MMSAHQKFCPMTGVTQKNCIYKYLKPALISVIILNFTMMDVTLLNALLSPPPVNIHVVLLNVTIVNVAPRLIPPLHLQ